MFLKTSNVFKKTDIPWKIFIVSILLMISMLYFVQVFVVFISMYVSISLLRNVEGGFRSLLRM